MSANTTQILHRACRGDATAQEELCRLLYSDLRARATALMNQERAGHTLQPTALVNEAWMRLINAGGQAREIKDRVHFLAAAATTMRHILIDWARARRAAKREGDLRRVSLSSVEPLLGGRESRMTDVLAVDDALRRLANLHARQEQVVAMRYFADMTVPEIAEALGVSISTVEQDWRMARAWLHRELSECGRT